MHGADVWLLAGGLSIFLFGMSLLETTLRELAGRSFKLFLRKHTSGKFEAILSGALVTGVLQSSSVVTMITLGFVGAEVISMRNALAVVFGSNLGTTLDSWLVASLGFRFSIESFALPVITVAGVGMVALSRNKKLLSASKLLMGLGLLFLGLAFMRDSIGTLVTQFDLTPYLAANTLTFILIGFLLTAIIQSSSATMVIVLSALNSGAIPFHAATALIIGSELGTSLKTVLGAIGDIPAKKRVAMGNIIFNLVITVFAYMLMSPLIQLIRQVIGVADPLIALVLFQTMINLAGIVLFFPFLDSFSDFLEKRFQRRAENATHFIHQRDSASIEGAVEMLEKESSLFILRVIRFSLEVFNIKAPPFSAQSYPISVQNTDNVTADLEKKYEHIKKTEGEIVMFYSGLSQEKLDKEELLRSNQLMGAIRNAMYSAKSIKDIRHDRRELRDSIDNFKYKFYVLLQTQIEVQYLHLKRLMEGSTDHEISQEIRKLLDLALDNYNERMKMIYQQSSRKSLTELEISTLFNISRELYSSDKAIVSSVGDYLVSETISAASAKAS